MPDKTPITEQIVEDGLSKLVPLMRGWLSSLENKFKQNSNGFHRSMQVWQALGVVAHELTRHKDLFLTVNYSSLDKLLDFWITIKVLFTGVNVKHLRRTRVEKPG
ncbi:hypothetical protein OGZ01_28640 [Vibrio harveyi]|nr:hypothetical protein [Vibrio harveyi]